MTVQVQADTLIGVLMEVAEEKRDKAWLQKCLQQAVMLELATVPPYLYAYYSVKDPNSELADALLGIAWQEMFHLGMACNLLTAAGRTPVLRGSFGDVPVPPAYPTKLPAGVRQVEVVLKGVSPTAKDPADVLRTFMDIEEPDEKVTFRAPGISIGAFYRLIIRELPRIAKEQGFGGGRQVVGAIGGDRLTAVTDVKQAVEAMELIAEQGEGTHKRPTGSTDPADLAHFYRFEMHWTGKRMTKVPGQENKWEYKGEDLPKREVHPLGQVPAGGWKLEPGQLGKAVHKCNTEYTELLRTLERQWQGAPETVAMDPLVGKTMFSLDRSVKALLALQSPPKHGPEFRVV